MGRLAMRLLESEPSDIEQWCAQVRQVDSRKAKRMLDPLVPGAYFFVGLAAHALWNNVRHSTSGSS